MSKERFVLGIIMRTDISTMNAGKAMAQAAHAANAFTEQMYSHQMISDYKFQTEFEEWVTSTPQGFGVTHVYHGNERIMYKTAYYAILGGYVNDIIIDPTYPNWMVGKIPPKEEIADFLVPMETCSYVFAPDYFFKNQGLVFYV